MGVGPKKFEEYAARESLENHIHIMAAMLLVTGLVLLQMAETPSKEAVMGCLDDMDACIDRCWKDSELDCRIVVPLLVFTCEKGKGEVQPVSCYELAGLHREGHGVEVSAEKSVGGQLDPRKSDPWQP